MDYRALARKKLLEELYDKMSDEEKRLYIQMSMQDRDHKEIMQALSELKQKAEDNHHPFYSDLLANIAGNGIWDGAIWLLSRLVRKL